MIRDSRNKDPKQGLQGAKWMFCGNGFDSNFLTGEDIYIPDESRVVIGLTDNFSHLSVITCFADNTANERIWQSNGANFPEDPRVPMELIFSNSKN